MYCTTETISVYVRNCTSGRSHTAALRMFLMSCVDRKLNGSILSVSPGAEEDASRCSWWFRLLVGRMRSCANNVGDG